MTLLSGNSTGEGGEGGSIIVKPGGGRLLNGAVEIQSSTGTQRVVASDSDVNVTSASGGGIYLAVPAGDSATNNVIGFSVSSTVDGSAEYDLRLQEFEDGESRVVSSVPLQVTTIEYSSDERIKEAIVDVDVDDILQRFMAVEMVEYAYTEEWRQVRNLDDSSRVRGVIAQQLAEVFPEHVAVVPEFELPDKDFAINDFLQVDKVTLTLDRISAIQAHHKHYSFGPNSGDRSGDIAVATEAGGSYPNADPTGASGSVLISTGTASLGDSGSITLTTGPAEGGSTSGSISIQVGGSDEDAPQVQLSELGVRVSAGQQTDPSKAGSAVEILSLIHI